MLGTRPQEREANSPGLEGDVRGFLPRRDWPARPPAVAWSRACGVAAAWEMETLAQPGSLDLECRVGRKLDGGWIHWLSDYSNC